MWTDLGISWVNQIFFSGHFEVVLRTLLGFHLSCKEVQIFGLVNAKAEKAHVTIEAIG